MSLAYQSAAASRQTRQRKKEDGTIDFDGKINGQQFKRIVLNADSEERKKFNFEYKIYDIGYMIYHIGYLLNFSKLFEREDLEIYYSEAQLEDIKNCSSWHVDGTFLLVRDVRFHQALILSGIKTSNDNRYLNRFFQKI